MFHEIDRVLFFCFSFTVSSQIKFSLGLNLSTFSMYKMSSEQESNILLVSVVEQYEELYNYNVEKYSNRQSQEKAWQVVADQVKSTGRF